MVVDFSVNEDDGKRLTRRKYLVAHSKEQTNSIFDYVYVESGAF